MYHFMYQSLGFGYSSANELLSISFTGLPQKASLCQPLPKNVLTSSELVVWKEIERCVFKASFMVWTHSHVLQ